MIEERNIRTLSEKAQKEGVFKEGRLKEQSGSGTVK